ncbi:hypothetical protein MVES1_003595 [Malassezia vespertilionis]|uniref:uncharacterized protein n=1 Tax=Malassezia vespertilionis TaxID=2020962 RepID=UPI0024B05FE9|nr:uncharacterized protein MVES1_003595 [Malassezia vespertilionis]WFD08223.1 hypothetical protein MVES1_003595 [Malassezia vespertilionis]
MRVVCVQCTPEQGKVQQNAAHIMSLVETVKPGSVDMLVLPEMALTGYVHDSLDAIEPFLENPYAEDGATFNLARDLATRLQCYVVAGFPERASAEALAAQHSPHLTDARHLTDELKGSPHLPQVRQKAFNAAMLVGRDGKLVHVFRKHFLYEPDATWADESAGFGYIDLQGIGRVSVAVCMDLNRTWARRLTTAYLLDSDFERYELAHFCDKNRVDFMVVCMNWLLPEEELGAYGESDGSAPSIPTINYWVTRAMPLWVPGMAKPGHEGHKVTMIACNRTGTERGM